MQKKIQRLLPVVKMAEEAENAAAAKLAQAQQQLQQSQQQLAGLEQYRDDYQQQWLQQGHHGVTGEWLMNYQRFLSQLEVAIEQQRHSLRWHETNVDKFRDIWQKRYARLEGLKKLVQKYRQQIRSRADKLEQKEMDEFAQRIGSSLRGNEYD